jgi:hypothetical protein
MTDRFAIIDTTALGLPAETKGPLESFLKPWRKRGEVLGCLLVGSYACELANDFSDIDLYFILADHAPERERGDHVVGRWTIEYNADPVRYVRSLQSTQFAVGNRHCARKVASGKVIFARDDTLAKLQAEAGAYMRMPVKRSDATTAEMAKYYMWDQIDNLRSLWHYRSPGFWYAYHCGIQNIVGHYAAFLGSEVLRPVRMHEFFTDEVFRKKYKIDAFPDALFMRMAASCIETPSLEKIEQLTIYVQEKMGGFVLDGWTLKVPA